MLKTASSVGHLIKETLSRLLWPPAIICSGYISGQWALGTNIAPRFRHHTLHKPSKCQAGSRYFWTFQMECTLSSVLSSGQSIHPKLSACSATLHKETLWIHAKCTHYENLWATQNIEEDWNLCFSISHSFMTSVCEEKAKQQKALKNKSVMVYVLPISTMYNGTGTPDLLKELQNNLTHFDFSLNKEKKICNFCSPDCNNTKPKEHSPLSIQVIWSWSSEVEGAPLRISLRPPHWPFFIGMIMLFWQWMLWKWEFQNYRSYCTDNKCMLVKFC